MVDIKISSDVEELVRGFAKVGDSATKGAKTAADAVGKISTAYLDADKAMARFETNRAKAFQRIAIDAGRAVEVARKATFAQADKEKADAINSWTMTQAEMKAARRGGGGGGSGIPPAAGGAGEAGASSAGGVIGTAGAIGGIVIASAGVVAAFNRAAEVVNAYNTQVANLGKAGGDKALGIDRSIRELGGNQEGLRQWAMDADTRNGLSIQDKTQFLSGLAGANKTRTSRGLRGFTDQEQTRAMRLYERGGGVAFGAGGEDIVDAMSSPMYNNGNLDHVMRWETKGRLGGYQAGMSAEQIADKLRRGAGTMADGETKIAAGESGAQFETESRNFRDGMREREVNATYQRDIAPGGRIGWDPNAIPLIGGLLESSEKASIRSQMDGDTTGDVQHSPISGILRLVGLMKRQNSIMEQQATPRPATRKDDQ